MSKKEGKVKSTGSDRVKFVYTGEDLESYNSALNYLVKRRPFGSKAKKR